MSRRKSSVKREVIPDPVFNDVVIAKFVNTIMQHGKKSIAQQVVYGALEEIKTKAAGEEPINVLKKAIENVKPALEVRSRRVGGATYQVPCDVRPSRRLALAMRWLTEYSRARGEKTMAARLAGELLDAYNNRGNSIKKREDVHKMAEANKAFAHYMW
jgi:small subunit ribosomal protein S7